MKVLLAVSAIVLAGAAALSWFSAAGARPTARPDIRFAAVLFAALAAAIGLAAAIDAWTVVAQATALLVSPLAATALGVAAIAANSRPPSKLAATLALMLGCVIGLLSAATGLALPAFADVAAAALVMLVAALRWLGREGALRIVPAALALVSGGLCLLENALAGAALFYAAGLLGVTRALSVSNAPVEEKGERNRSLPVGRLR